MQRVSEVRSRQVRRCTAGPPPAPRGGLQIVGGHQDVLEGTTVRHRLGEVTVSLVQGGPRELVRPARLIADGERPRLRMCRPLYGEVRVFQDGRHGVVRPPQLISFDTGRPFKVVMPGEFRMVDVMVTHSLVGLTADDTRRLTARAWNGDQGAAALLSSLLEGLDRHGEEVETAVDLLGASVAGLTAVLLAERMREAGADSEIARQALMLRVQAHVREHLADPGLSPVEVARRHNISLRYLQKIFQEFGVSPARWIRDERLARCRSELADPTLDHLPVALVGERAGLYGASHFSRLFRGRYGVTPSEFRKERRAMDHHPGHPGHAAANAGARP
ncbi:helix-turn-helix domain-containing protein [Streptomyces sp. NPDC048002]|uniref:helix-turn-helix domain-containing protein n=1 Tax=unclassified Streptomyces TaxID=2593676 RepID=UPI0034073C5C